MNEEGGFAKEGTRRGTPFPRGKAYECAGYDQLLDRMQKAKTGGPISHGYARPSSNRRCGGGVWVGVGGGGGAGGGWGGLGVGLSALTIKEHE